MKGMHSTMATIAILVSGLVVTAPPAAADASRQETIGVGAGGLIGAVAGGPFGFMAGAAVGAKLGDMLHQKDERNRELDAELANARQSVGQLEAELAALDGDARALQQRLHALLDSGAPQMLELLETGIAMDLLFRTEADTLSAETAARVDELGRILASLPQVQIRLDAYADPRGEAEYNQSLSERRAQHVRALLLAGGVPESRVTAEAHGEVAIPETDADANALERRVSLTLYVPRGSGQQVADSR